MKTEGMKHQIIGAEMSQRRSYFGYLMEQGTGKTWLDIYDAEFQFGRDKIDCFLVLAPNGVHTNWTRIELPTHMSAPHVAMAWRTGMGVRELKKLTEILKPTPGVLRILTMSYDAVNTAKGFAFAKEFLESAKLGAKMSCDESQKIKTYDSKRTIKVLQLSSYPLVRRILSGTPITKNPGDAFSQLQFLKEGLAGTSSYRAFFSEYAQLLNAQNPTTQSDWQFRKEVEKNPRMAFALRVAKDDITGQPIYRNLDKLGDLIRQHSYRVLKKDCLDLPPKVYTTRHYELGTKQMAAYRMMEDEYRIMLEDGEVLPVHRLAALVKLQQITSGYVMVPGRDEVMFVSDENPRLELLKEVLEDVEGKAIIWARFKEEIAVIAQHLKAVYGPNSVAEYHGGVSHKDRPENIDRFQQGDARWFLGNAQAGGTGLTLTAAETTVYYSNSYNNGDRLQSEDRNHRKGTKNTVVYIDLSCAGTIDETVARSLQLKTNIASAILDERNLDASGVDFESESE